MTIDDGGNTTSVWFKDEREAESFAEEERAKNDSWNGDRLTGQTRTNNADAKPSAECHDRNLLLRAPLDGGRGCQGWLIGVCLDSTGSADGNTDGSLAVQS